MNKDVITVRTAQDKEIAAKTMMKYDLITLPVVDTENRLVGIITSDDVMDVIEEEATEDFEKMAAMQPSEKPYLKTNVFALARKRIGWLLILMISGMITGGILGKFEAAFSALPLLVTFIPMITDTGGNSGSQSSTLIIRGMAVGEITPRDLPKVLWKELRVSLIVGIVLSAVNYVRLIITYPATKESRSPSHWQCLPLLCLPKRQAACSPLRPSSFTPTPQSWPPLSLPPSWTLFHWCAIFSLHRRCSPFNCKTDCMTR